MMKMKTGGRGNRGSPSFAMVFTTAACTFA
jgi:hypothetical protein